MNVFQLRRTKFKSTNNRKTYILSAMEEALRSTMRSKHGAIIVKNGKIIAKGHNYEIHNPHRGFSSKYSVHAEIAAMNRVGNRRKLKSADIYVVRLYFDLEDRQISLKNSKPCHDCFKKISKCMTKYGLRTVYFSEDET